MCHEPSKANLAVERHKPIPIVYDGLRLDAGFKADLVVAGRVVVELKAVEALLPVHEAQLMTYLRLSGIRVGLIISFNVTKLVNGIVRRVI